jgi:hypothetical protein
MAPKPRRHGRDIYDAHGSMEGFLTELTSPPARAVEVYPILLNRPKHPLGHTSPTLIPTSTITHHGQSRPPLRRATSHLRHPHPTRPILPRQPRPHGTLGWLYLQLFCTVRIVGAALIIHQKSSTGLAALIVGSFGLSPLLLCAAGILHES